VGTRAVRFPSPLSIRAVSRTWLTDSPVDIVTQRSGRLAPYQIGLREPVQQQHCRASAAVADASHGSIGLHRRRLREVVSVRLRTRGGQRHVPGHGSLAHDRFVAVDRVPNRRVRSGQRANATRPRPQLCRQSASAGPLAGGSRPCRVLLLLTLVVLRYIDETNLSVRTR
jgi:hypothetical protein